MVLDLESMSIHRNSLGYMKTEESNISDSNLISINYVGFNSLFSMTIALFRIKSCRCVRYC